MLPPGTRLGRYEIRAQIGSGGMGEVYQAMDVELQRVLALKVLPPEFAADPSRMRRFIQEEVRPREALIRERENDRRFMIEQIIEMRLAAQKLPHSPHAAAPQRRLTRSVWHRPWNVLGRELRGVTSRSQSSVSSTPFP